MPEFNFNLMFTIKLNFVELKCKKRTEKMTKTRLSCFFFSLFSLHTWGTELTILPLLQIKHVYRHQVNLLKFVLVYHLFSSLLAVKFKTSLRLLRYRVLKLIIYFLSPAYFLKWEHVIIFAKPLFIFNGWTYALKISNWKILPVLIRRIHLPTNSHFSDIVAVAQKNIKCALVHIRQTMSWLQLDAVLWQKMKKISTLIKLRITSPYFKELAELVSCNLETGDVLCVDSSQCMCLWSICLMFIGTTCSRMLLPVEYVQILVLGGKEKSAINKWKL